MDEFGLEDQGYEFKKKIGRGSFSKVYSASFTNKAGEKFDNVAIKVVDLWRVNKKYRERFLPREIEIMRKLQKVPHLNIIDIHVS